MPHLIIEHSANISRQVAIAGVVDAMHDAALGSGLVPLDALRTRAVERDRYAIADRHEDNAFVAVTIRVGAGRTVEQRQALAVALMDALDEALGDARRTAMLSVECQEIDAQTRINRNHLRSVIAERNPPE